MQNQYTSKNSHKSLPFRAAALLFLTLLLISCPLKRELKAAFLGQVPTGNQSAAAQFPKQMVGNVSAADFE